MTPKTASTACPAAAALPGKEWLQLVACPARPAMSLVSQRDRNPLRYGRTGLFTHPEDPAELTLRMQNLPCAHMLRNKLGSMFLTWAKKEVVLSLMYLDLTLDQEKTYSFSMFSNK